MKKTCWFLLVCALVGWRAGAVQAEYAAIDVQLNLRVPAAVYGGERYALDFAPYAGAQEAGSILWKLVGLTPGEVDGDGVPVLGNLNVIVPHLQYGEWGVAFSLRYAGQSSEPFLWRLGTAFASARSPASTVVDPAAVPAADLDQVILGNTAFAVALFHALRPSGGNLFFSPHSISLALAMTYAGAAGDTAREMADTLRFSLAPERLHAGFARLGGDLADRGAGAGGKDGAGFRLNVANALWGQVGYPFRLEFLDVLAVNYGAGLGLLDFIADSEGARATINGWVADQTEGRIDPLLAEGTLTDLTRLVLTNAIYFNAAWRQPFEEAATAAEQFFQSGTSQILVPMMSQRSHFGYTAGADYQALEMRYDGEQLSLVALLPAAGQMTALEDSLTPERLDTILAELQPAYVQLKFPKFTYSSGAVSLKKTLASMGMPTAFGLGADFSGIDGTRNLSISEVVHQAFIAVDEAGTEAAAATAVVVSFTGLPTEAIPVTFNRPFVYLIRDIPTGAILFMGRVLNPR